MKAYRTTVKIKLGLIIAAVLIAALSLFYTNTLANRVAEQEQNAVRLWVKAIEYQAQTNLANPYTPDFLALEGLIDDQSLQRLLSDSTAARYISALTWAQSMPPSDGLDFVFNEIIEPARFDGPAIITDSLRETLVVWRNVDIDSTLSMEEQERVLLEVAAELDEINDPIRFEYIDGEVQFVHYGESRLARLIRWFPPIQLGFVALFIFVGYLGFSYVRRSEQSNLWVGMAKEAAHQLGTPLSSMMGWIELLKMDERKSKEAIQATSELELDVERLRRVADRFEKIGSKPDVRPTELRPVVLRVAKYIERRIPKQGPRVEVSAEVAKDLTVLLNAELFEWVIENLLKNALDAVEGGGMISIAAEMLNLSTVRIAVSDNGKGIERSEQRHIFRPGFSTKKRGWGLGLSLSKRIIEEYHGGSLTLLESRPGEGTTFGIDLPVSAPIS